MKAISEDPESEDTKSGPHSGHMEPINMHSSISKLNKDYNRYAVYNVAVDVALLPLPEVRSHSSKKLHIPSNTTAISAPGVQLSSKRNTCC